jgi:hypothetical protein
MSQSIGASGMLSTEVGRVLTIALLDDLDECSEPIGVRGASKAQSILRTWNLIVESSAIRVVDDETRSC